MPECLAHQYYSYTNVYLWVQRIQLHIYNLASNIRCQTIGTPIKSAVYWIVHLILDDEKKMWVLCDPLITFGLGLGLQACCFVLPSFLLAHLL